MAANWRLRSRRSNSEASRATVVPVGGVVSRFLKQLVPSGVAVAIAASGLAVATSPTALAARVKAPAVQETKSLPHTVVEMAGGREVTVPRRERREGVAWPAPSAGTVEVDSGDAAVAKATARRRVGSTPVFVELGKKQTGGRFDARVASHDIAVRAGLSGVVFTLDQEQTPGVAPAAEVSVGLDYAAFENAVGAGYGRRLKLVAVPRCILTTPERDECRVQRPLASVNDTESRTVSASAPASVTTFAAVADASGESGSFAATPLAPSASWSTSGATGSFTWQYDVPLPPAPVLTPKVALSYNSASVDGRNIVTNNQPSTFGQGWDYDPGYVERTYRTCADNKSLPVENQTGDLCWERDVITLVMDGKSTALVRDQESGRWQLADDNGELVEHLTGANSSARDGEYWRITAADGKRYYFGLNVLPGGSEATATDSVLTVPVVGAQQGEPCYDAGGFGQSRCRQAWRWNLDYVEDPHGNAVAYYYTVESNHYGPNNNTTPVKYSRASYLERIEYGLRNSAGSIYQTPAAQRVLFDTTQRCIPDASFDCDPARFNATNASHWPDTPQDQACDAEGDCENHAPTFWSQKRTNQIRTQVATGSGYRTVDSFSLTQSFPAWGEPEFTLDAITRTGTAPDGTTLAMPPVTFESQPKPNRVGTAGMQFSRLIRVQTETGKVVSIRYSDEPDQVGRAKPMCTLSTVPTGFAQNTTECFPVFWTPPYDDERVVGFFHKYVVTEVDTYDPNGVSPARISTYKYLGDPAWHYDDNEVVRPKYRSYAQFRGYGAVEVRTGDLNASSNGAADKQTLTRTTYLRGMDGDRLPDDASRSVTVHDSQGTAYRDHNAFAGKALEVETFLGASGPRLASAITAPGLVATTAVRPRTDLPAQEATIVRPLSSTDITDLAAGGTSVSRRTNSYDGLGRLRQASETGTGVAPKCTRTSYAEDAAARIRTLPAEITQAGIACPSLSTPLTSVLSNVRHYYGSATLGAVVGAGSLTKTLTATSTVDGATNYARSIFTSDLHGRNTSTTSYTSAADAVGRTTTTQFTPTLDGPVTQIRTTNAAGQQSNSTLDPGRGVPLRVVEIDGQTTDAQYDPLGRLTAVWNPGRVKGTDSASVTYAYTLEPTAPLAVTTKTLVDIGTSSSYRTSISLYDAFGALRQTQTDGTTGGRVVTDSFTDSHGWVIRTNNRWYTSGAPTTTLIVTPDSGVDSRTLTVHDGAGRVTSSTEYKGSTPGAVTRNIYGGDRVTVIPPTGGVTTTSRYDVRGQRIELDRFTAEPTVSGNVVSGNSYQRTTYAFDALGRQYSMTDAAGTDVAATWTSTYDLAGRVVTKTDPDSGVTTSTYNDTGDLVSVTDGSGATLSYEYDKLGRKRKLFHGAATAENLRASWTYDTKQAGKLTASTRYDSGGAAQVTVAVTDYDATGNPLGTSTRIAEGGFLSDYTTIYTWTKTQLLKSQKLAASSTGNGGVSSETINYAYNAAGEPISATGLNAYVSATNYTPYAEVNQYTLGVNTLTAWLTYTRDAQTRRITAANLSGQTSPSQLEKVAYTYDPVGNITKIVDTQGAATGAPVQTQCFTYDKLNQLTQAWSSTDSCATDPTNVGNTSKVGGPQSYWTTWEIDAAGSRTSQVQHAVPGGLAANTTTTYTMETPGHAHALTSTSTQVGAASPITASYEYDANGNVTKRDGQTITYTPEHQVDSISAAGGTVSYVYDADGNQVLRRDGGSRPSTCPGRRSPTQQQPVPRRSPSTTATTAPWWRCGPTRATPST